MSIARNRPGFRWVWATALAAALGAAADARAQSSSLLGNPKTRRPLAMGDVSWTYIPPVEPKRWKLNDTVTVLIEEKTKMINEGQVDQRKKIEGAMSLKDWIKLEDFSLIPDPQSEGDPAISGIVDNKYRAQANLQNRSSFESHIQCTVTDVRPNGTLVIEGHDRVRIDEEEYELSLSGIIQAEDILPNKSIKSEKIAEKSILLRSAGHGRDGIRRGFLLKLLDKFQPF